MSDPSSKGVTRVSQGVSAVDDLPTPSTGSSVFTFTDTAVLAVSAVDAPEVITSSDIDGWLAPAYASAGVHGGMLEQLAGISERRWWPSDVSFADAAAMAGAKAIAEAGVDP